MRIFYTILFLFITAYISCHCFSQTMTGAMPAIDLTEKTVYDTAMVKIFYEYSYRKDSTVADKKENGETVLFLGKRYCGFLDYYAWKTDSINDAYYAEKRSPMELISACMALGKSIYPYPLIKDIKDKKATIQINGLGTYQYTQELPKLEWVIEEDSVIKGIECQKAHCNFAGRTWEAWFAMDYPVPYGPYLFDGLPGLTVLLKDTKDNFSFTLNGLVNIPQGEEIYLKKSTKTVKTTREKARRAYRNEMENPLQGIKMNMPGVIVPEETARTIKSKPYNPIELE